MRNVRNVYFISSGSGSQVHWTSPVLLLLLFLGIPTLNVRGISYVYLTIFSKKSCNFSSGVYFLLNLSSYHNITMVHLFRGGSAGGRGRGFARPPGFIPRHIRPNWFEPDFVPPFGFGGPIPNTLARPPLRPGPRPHRIPAPPLPPPPLRPRPLPPLVRHFPPIPLCPPGRGLSIPPHMPSGNFRSTIGHTLPLRGRGGHANRGAQVKRLVSPNDRAKKQQKRKERTEVS